jgi:hypothetical protein
MLGVQVPPRLGRKKVKVCVDIDWPSHGRSYAPSLGESVTAQRFVSPDDFVVAIVSSGPPVLRFQEIVLSRIVDLHF